MTDFLQPIDKGSPTKPLTLAYLGSSPGGRFSFEKWLMWRGLADAVKKSGANLIYIAGEEYARSPQAVLYQLVDRHHVDGIIIWNTFVNLNNPLTRAQEFIAQFAPLPIVNIELALPDCSNLLIDYDKGMRELLAHLIEDHQYQKIAFVGLENNLISKERQDLFEKNMRKYGLLDKRLIGSIETIDMDGINWGKDCQAVVADLDSIAVNLIDLFQSRGIRVPQDVVVTGFNDGQVARSSLPALTSVRLPFRSLGRKAVEMLLSRINGETVPDTVYLPSTLTLRRSCGCLEPMAEQAAAGSANPLWSIRGAAEQPENHHNFASSEHQFQAEISRLRAVLPGMLSTHLGISIETLATAWSAQLVAIFTGELERCMALPGPTVPSSQYLQELSILLREAVEEGSLITRWHEALSICRQHFLPHLHGSALAAAEDMFHQARVLVGQVAVRTELNRSWHSARRNEILREIEAELLISLDFTELLDILTAGLARLEVKNFHIVLYENGYVASGLANLVLAIQDGHRLPLSLEPCTFPVHRLLPDFCKRALPDKTRVIEALHLRDEQIGYMVFEASPPPDPSECDIYQALRIQISSAIKGVRLRQILHDARKKADDANQLKSRFLSMVSHELRTPLNLIVGLSEMAMRQQSRSKDSFEVIKKFLEQIYVSGQHLDRLIRDVLDLASSQVGQMTIVLKPVDLNSLLEEMSQMGTQLARQKNLHFRFEKPDNLPQVNGDKTRLRQILLNLLSNAVKFTAHGEVALLVTQREQEIIISIEDTGLGIPQEDQEHIFDEFHQTDRSVTRGYGGIGLGLAITRRLVELHEGRIWVSSSGMEGGGSTFSFILPVLQQVEAGETALLAVTKSKRLDTVLILTSAADSAQPLAAHLSKHGFHVEESPLTNTAETIENLTQDPPGALVLDLAPAQEQGWEIMKMIKDNPATHDIPVLFYSLMQEQDSGAVIEMDYLKKPVSADDLVKALKRYGLIQSGRREHHKILIVDDDPGISELHARLVRTELPYSTVFTAQNGKEGLQKMRAEIPDIVLLDLMMPEMDGFEVLKAMQLEEMIRNIPVIVLSSQVLTQREMNSLSTGVAAVLSKGVFSTQEILVRIEDVLSRNKGLGSKTKRLVQQAMAHIHENYDETLTRGGIASYLNINEQYLTRCFIKELGIGPMVYLSRYRIQRAKRLLEIGELSITQVAMEVGMSSQSYFSRVFQEETGTTPSAYQRGMRVERN
jgi:signal transduction histidine kinase/DNA-binding LacI/PurR family transcriptional regulator/DNA-binding response OmpR family regulator